MTFGEKKKSSRFNCSYASEEESPLMATIKKIHQKRHTVRRSSRNVIPHFAHHSYSRNPRVSLDNSLLLSQEKKRIVRGLKPRRQLSTSSTDSSIRNCPVSQFINIVSNHHENLPKTIKKSSIKVKKSLIDNTLDSVKEHVKHRTKFVLSEFAKIEEIYKIVMDDEEDSRSTGSDSNSSQYHNATPQSSNDEITYAKNKQWM